MNLGNEPYAQLPGYYQHAKLNLFASSCENCPNILLEALAGGRPVLCSDYQPMPEFGADHVQYFDPYNPEQLAVLLERNLDDVAGLSEWGRRAAERADAFQWTIAARQTWDALYSLVSEASYCAVLAVTGGGAGGRGGRRGAGGGRAGARGRGGD